MMKRAWMLLTALLLITLCMGGAAEGMTLQQLAVGEHRLMTPDSYPQVVINPYREEGVYLTELQKNVSAVFPCPSGFYAEEFYLDRAAFRNSETQVSIAYRGMDSNSYEYGALLRSVSKGSLFQDGVPDGCTASVDAKKGTAYGLMPLDGVGKDAWLSITVADETVSSETDAAGVERLKNLLRSEMKRVREQAVYEARDVLWTRNMFDGFELISSVDPGFAVRVKLPQSATVAGQTGAAWDITRVRNNELIITAYFGDMKIALLSFRIETRSMVNQTIKYSPDIPCDTLLVNGSEYRLILTEDNVMQCARADALLTDKAGSDGEKKLYLNIDASQLAGMKWQSMEQLKNDLSVLLSGIQFVCYDAGAAPRYDDYAPYGELTWTAPVTYDLSGL